MIGEIAIANIITGIIRTHKIDKWGRLIIGCMMSGFMTFAGTTGAGGLAHIATGSSPSMAFVLGMFEGLMASAATVFYLWVRNPLSKDIPIAIPTSIEKESIRIQQEQGMTTFGGDKK